jgi:hypothetical protein
MISIRGMQQRYDASRSTIYRWVRDGIAEDDEMSYTDADGNIYMPFAQGMPDERHETLFQKQFGKDIYEASTTRFNNLARIRLWPSKQGKALLSVDIPEGGNQNTTLRKLQEHVGKIVDVVGDKTIGSVSAGNDDMGSIRMSLSDFLLAGNIRDLKGMKKSLAGAFLLRKSKGNPNHGELGRFASSPLQHIEDMQIAKGKLAMHYAIQHKTSVKNAMSRPEIGNISFVWGYEGDPNKEYSGGYGIAHIIAKRDWEGLHNQHLASQKGDAVAIKIVEVIAKGNVLNPESPGKKKILYDGYIAIITPHGQPEHENWVLTGFKETAPGGLSKARHLSEPTHTEPTGTRLCMGAGANQRIPNSKNEINKSLAGAYLIKSRPANIHSTDGNQKRPAVGLQLRNARLHGATSVTDHLISKGLTNNRHTGQVTSNGLQRIDLATGIVKGFADCIGNDQSSHNTLQKSESPSERVKTPEQNDIRKAHVAAYDRVTKTGALVHIAGRTALWSESNSTRLSKRYPATSTRSEACCWRTYHRSRQSYSGSMTTNVLKRGRPESIRQSG